MIHKIFRDDELIKEILESSEKLIEELKVRASHIGNEFFFDTMSLKGINIMEKELDIRTLGKTLEIKKSEIEGKWKTSGKCDLELLKKITLSWENGDIDVTFKNGGINIEFNSKLGIPKNITSLKIAIDKAKPAHLEATYNFKYRMWKGVKDKGKTWEQYKTAGITWKDLREKERI